jgi:ParB-like nuclease family protein
MSTTHIELSKLAISPENARKTFSKSGIDEMQASILVHGLMQNPVITEANKYYATAIDCRSYGGRMTSWFRQILTK